MKAPRILLLGDYSNCHHTLSTGLKALGCDVTVASDGTSWMNTARDIDITRGSGKGVGLLYYLKMHRLLSGRLSGYDIVAINDPNFCRLKPERLTRLFRLLKSRNKGVFLTSMSTDIAYLDMIEAVGSPLRYNEWFIGGKPSPWHIVKEEEWCKWHDDTLRRYQEYVFDNLDGAVSVLYEYHLGIKRRMGGAGTAYGGIPIDMTLFEPSALPERPERVRLFLGRDRNRKEMKGSELLEAAARAVVSRHPDKAELEIVENVPWTEFRERMSTAHVVLDQIYSYTPATTALMAMAMGLNVVSGGEPEYYEFIGEDENRPIINAPLDVAAIEKTIEDIVLHPEELSERGRRSRAFVAKHNEATVVAHRFLSFWQRKLAEKGVEIC